MALKVGRYVTERETSTTTTTRSAVSTIVSVQRNIPCYRPTKTGEPSEKRR